ncbi:hypothetical protein GGX14DRAFT_352947 [Mycena pura]|uniref:RNase H type-1 domain-containing protein n=1 Tax=Mycena pura TaxID=153505 RepID=A0AAD7E1B9_9AGAR|nr:hypothetical protein GGX14DRAFT_352947 [Mycena pura]
MDEESKTNLVIQGFPVSQRDPPALHRTLVKCVYKYGVKFEAIDPPMEILRAMPLWHHPGENDEKRQENNGQRAKCLRKNHAALEIGDGVDMAICLEDPLHSGRATCTCVGCTEDQEKRGCENPHACVAKAASRLRQIHPRWVPGPGGQRGPMEPVEYDEDSGIFIPPAQIASLSQGLRVMTNREGEPVERPAQRTQRRVRRAPVAQDSVVYTAGVIHTPPGKCSTAAAAFAVDGSEQNQPGKHLPAESDQLQYIAEFFAVLAAVRSVNENTTLTIYSAQPYVREAMSKNFGAGSTKVGWGCRTEMYYGA